MLLNSRTDSSKIGSKLLRPARLRHGSPRRRRRSAPAVERMEERTLLSISSPTNLVAWWPGDGSTADIVGGHDGTLVGGAGYAPGEVSQSFDFNGTDGFVQVPDSDLWAFGTHNFSINMWVNFNKVQPSTVAQPTAVFIGDGEGPGSVNKWTFALGGDQLYFHINDPVNGPYFLTVPFTLNPGQWYDLRVTRSGSLFTFYVGGAAIGTGTSTLAVPDGNTPLTIGCSGNAFFMDGRIDEVQIYDRALSPAEVAGIAAAGSNGLLKQAVTTTTLTASANASLLNQPVAFTATITTPVTGLGTPTGSVQFIVDGSNFGAPIPLVGGTATFNTATLAVGGHTVTASYSGDGTFQTSLATTSVNVLPPASLSGIAFSDFNNDGQVDFGEQGIAGVTINLDGTDFLGSPIHLMQTTDSAGAYVFLNLPPGTYTITETQQPAGYTQGVNSIGTGGGTVSGDQFTVSLPVGLDAMNYNYGERPAATGPIQHGQTAGIGFWNNKNGQALIKALNGGVGTQLGDWLAATFPHVFGASSGGNNLALKNNAYVASFFQSRFVVKDQKLDAQVLATALAVYVTDGTLDSTGVGTQYGFIVGGNGVATATYNIGANGDAFGVADNTTMTVMDLLLAADAQAVNGMLYNGNTVKRNKANNVFSAINQAGSI